MDAYLKFWSRALGLEVGNFSSPAFALTTKGAYVEKHGDRYVFLFRDLSSGKNVLAGSENSLGRLTSKADFLKNLIANPPAFDDLDFGLLQRSAFHPFASTDIRRLSANDEPAIDLFLNGCSEDDRDTLDLTFEQDVAFATINAGLIQGISRYVPVKSCPSVADITVLISPSARGKGHSIPLVSAVVEEILRQELTPKYRVAANNAASIATAKRLGFQAMFEFKTWETSELINKELAQS